jgi:hypothetical protein
MHTRYYFNEIIGLIELSVFHRKCTKQCFKVCKSMWFDNTFFSSSLVAGSCRESRHSTTLRSSRERMIRWQGYTVCGVLLAQGVYVGHRAHEFEIDMVRDGSQKAGQCTLTSCMSWLTQLLVWCVCVRRTRKRPRLPSRPFFLCLLEAV